MEPLRGSESPFCGLRGYYWWNRSAVFSKYSMILGLALVEPLRGNGLPSPAIRLINH